MILNDPMASVVAELRAENARLTEENVQLRRDLQSAKDAFEFLSETFLAASHRIQMLKPELRPRRAN